MVPSLIDLCVKKWFKNVWLLGDVGGIDDYLLDRMLPLCSADQLNHVEVSTKGRDLSLVTDKLWKAFYEKHFGNTDEVIENKRKNQVPFKWKQVYEYKVKETEAYERMWRLTLEQCEFDYRGDGYNECDPTAKEKTGFLSSEEEEEEEEDDDFTQEDEEEDEDDEETDVEVAENVEEVSVEEVEEVEREEHNQTEEGEDDNENEAEQEGCCCDDRDDDSFGNNYYDDGYGDCCGYNDSYDDGCGYDDDCGWDYDCDSDEH